MNRKNEIVIPAKFEIARNFSNGLAAVRVNDLWGYINNKGVIVIEPKYKTANNFKGDYAEVSFEKVPDFGPANYIYIDKTGKEIPESEILGEPLYHDGLKRFQDANGNFGFKNNKNQIVIPAIYFQAENFKGDGWVACKLNDGIGTTGVINTKGETIIPFNFDYIGYDLGKYVSARTGNGECRIYNTQDGTFIKVDHVDKIHSFDKNGTTTYMIEGKSGFIDYKGNILSPAIFDDTSSGNEGLAKVSTNGELQVYDIVNKKVLCTLPNASGWWRFKDGIAKIEVNKKFGLIDKFGKIIVPTQYLELGHEYNEDLIYFAEAIPVKVTVNIIPANTQTNTTYQNQNTTTTSGNISVTSYALDIFSELGSMAIYVGTTMNVVKIKGKTMGDQGSIAARAAQAAGIRSAYKYQWFPGKNCTTLKSQYGSAFSVVCNGEIDLNK